jgi:2,4-dienoyl-CoA reductase-like NADH-dependent reductase (Old Yellow Enzyme family)/thioredoxin reductase
VLCYKFTWLQKPLVDLLRCLENKGYVMSKKYQNLLSPMKIGNVVFKNRLMAAPSRPRRVQGSEPYPTEPMITHYATKARNGAALVNCGGLSAPLKIVAEKYYGFDGHGYDHYRIEDDVEGGGLRDTLGNHLYQLTEAVHFYGSKATIGIMELAPPKYDVSAGIPMRVTPESPPGVTEEISADLLDEAADEYALKAAFMKEVGFDGLYVHMAYRGGLLGRFLSPLTNKRTDQFGGSLENQARFPIMLADRIKQKCGRDFILEACISGSEPYPGGLTLEDTKEYARMFAGHFDLLQVRAGEQDPAHPTGFNLDRTPFLYMAEAIKKSGADIAVVTIGGFQDLDVCEDVITSGKADFIAMARAWISNPDYGRLAYEGRGEDVVPCLRCNKCHMNPCAVNPAWGFEHKIERMIEPPTDKKKVAVIGGGPAGMEAALVAAGRGHRVTLYEKSGALGGLLKTADYPSFKWPYKDFKNYLVRQIEKSSVEVLLNTEATPAMLQGKGYDAVLAAVGSEPIVPDIPGVDGANVVFAQDVYGNEATLAEKVVVIGGGEVGVETGMYLAELGHQVTILEMIDMIAATAFPAHYYSMLREAWEKLENFKSIVNVRCNGISAGRVTYLDADDEEHAIAADSVVIAVGFKPKNDLALEFYSTANRFFMIGDCNGTGDVEKAMRSAYSNASVL